MGISHRSVPKLSVHPRFNIKKKTVSSAPRTKIKLNLHTGMKSPSLLTAVSVAIVPCSSKMYNKLKQDGSWYLNYLTGKFGSMYLLRVVFILPNSKSKLTQSYMAPVSPRLSAAVLPTSQAAGDKSRATKREHLEPEFKTAISWGQKNGS